MTQPLHPVQPLVTDGHNVVRFKQNAVVRFLLDWASARGMDLNRLAMMDFPDEDRAQLAQLIGYSLRGFSELSYVDDATFARAEAQVIPDAT